MARKRSLEKKGRLLCCNNGSERSLKHESAAMSHFGGPADAVEHKALALGGILAEYLMECEIARMCNIPLKHLRNLGLEGVK